MFSHVGKWGVDDVSFHTHLTESSFWFATWRDYKVQVEIWCMFHEHTFVNHSLIYPRGESFLELLSSLDFIYSVEEQRMCSGLVGLLMAITWYLPMP